ncbi:type IX secretion system membrane protein, PorP/SprF family [Chitinophaga costaii]|uniref:Type IX secretion system membrane protein, PorP/SprF family n=1 Tax=Chitinophaga costaii TaxID=1335309 RepID=A0A1C3Z111_9BACT|nr:PorP/SprF family type IX secretion system membrane protein [Chitinophaga costaii]PUZ30186.1 type IX secretion system membrane protein PorP/SprF [Chitinophaga costaii]SCB75958.1 type IX secretion system membrane protein, PorP/SprF family [Chitinophaga costaii]
MKQLNRYIRLFLGCTLLAGLGGTAAAQSFNQTQALLEPSGTQYFQNQFLANPAMAGIDTGLHVNIAYRKQWNEINGAPVTKYLTADYQVSNRVGIGFHLMSDEAGLIDRTRGAFTYAYRVPLGQQHAQLSLALSLALDLQHLDVNKLDADPNDPSIGKYNRRDNFFEGEFGAAYTNDHFTLQAALPNVRSLFTGDTKTVDGGSLYYTAAEYKFDVNTTISSITPKVAYRGVRGYAAIFDVGVNVRFFHDIGNIMLLYHTAGSVTAGVGFNILKTVTLQALYTSQTGGIKTYVDGTFEIGLALHLFK